MGKSVGDDLAEGKPTLPLIYTMKQGTAEAAERVKQAILTGGLEQLDTIIKDVQSCGAIEYTEQKAQEQADLAISAIADLPESEYKATLITLAQSSVKLRV